MDIKWKDDYGRIINATNNKIKIKNKEGTVHTFLKEDIQRIELNDGMLLIYSHDNLLDEIDIPQKKFKEAVKIFNAFDRTGRIFKKSADTGSMTFFETLATSGDPISNLVMFILFSSVVYLIVSIILFRFFGGYSSIVFILIILVPIVMKVLLYVKRKKLQQ